MAPARNYDSLTHAVLIQSNPNPKNITDLSWSLVSAWPRDAIVRSDQYSSHVCHTDPETGVFTVMSNFSANIDHFNYQDLAALETPLRLPGGFQYTPPERRGIEGGDPWRDIRLSQGYQWGNVSATYDVFRWPGSTSIFHARIGNATIGTIRIAEVTMIHETTIGGPKLSIDITNYTLVKSKNMQRCTEKLKYCQDNKYLHRELTNIFYLCPPIESGRVWISDESSICKQLDLPTREVDHRQENRRVWLFPDTDPSEFGSGCPLNICTSKEPCCV